MAPSVDGTRPGASPAEADAEAGEAFCPSEQLTTRIRNILGDYPAGVASLKEMLQNADDARARDFRVLYDDRPYAADKLLSASLAPLQRAPAVLVFNDGVFSERDFRNILSLGDSAKRQDVGTVGKYGLGFNVVYHLADVVSFVSNDRLVVFDPHGIHLPGGAVGRRYTLDEVKRVAPDALAPFAAAARALHLGSCAAAALDPSEGQGADALSQFPGTLFRLPLRDAASAAESLLCNEALSGQRARALLAEFAVQAPDMVLFLQHIDSIGVYEALSAEGAEAATLTGGATVVNALSPGVRAARATVVLRQEALVAAQVAAATSSRDQHSVATAGIAASAGEPGAEETEEALHESRRPVAVSFPLTVRQEPGGNETTWAVRGGFEPRLASLAAELGQLAFAWVAFPVLRAAGGCTPETLGGRLYCGLPLPTTTGLPFHANAPFALSSNRRDLWIASRLGDADRQGAAGRLARWNEGLLVEAVPRLLVDLLLEVRPVLRPASPQEGSPAPARVAEAEATAAPVPRVADVEALYSLLPRPSVSAGGFADVATAALRHLVEARAPLFADANYGVGAPVDGARPEATSGAADASEPRWLSAQEVTFLLPSFERTVQASGVRAKLRQLRLPGRAEGLQCVAVPPDLTAALLAATAPSPASEVPASNSSDSSEHGEEPSCAASSLCGRPAVLSRSLLCQVLQPLAPPPPLAVSVAAARLFAAREADELLSWLLEPVDKAEEVYEEGGRVDEGKEGSGPEVPHLDVVPLVPLSIPVAGDSTDLSGVLGVLRRHSDGLPNSGTAEARLEAAEATLYLNPHPHIHVGRMLSGFQRLIDPAARSTAALLALAGKKCWNIRQLSPNMLAQGLVRFVVPVRWLGCRLFPAQVNVAPALGSIGEAAAEPDVPAKAPHGTDRGGPASGSSKKPDLSMSGRGRGKKDKVKQRQLARRGQRAQKEAGDAWTSGPADAQEDEDDMAGADPASVTNAAASQHAGKHGAIGVPMEQLVAAVERIGLFWRFLDEYPYWQDLDGCLDAWPLIATDEGPQLLPRRAALSRRVLRARDLQAGELPLLRRFGALTLHEALRPLSRPSGWGCVPRREALAALSRAQAQAITNGGKGEASAAGPFEHELCLSLRHWVRRFVQQEGLQETGRAPEDAELEQPLIEDERVSTSCGGEDALDDNLGYLLPLEKLLPALPIFETVGRCSCIALGTGTGPRWPVGAPSPDGPFAVSSPWDVVLGGMPEWSSRLLSYSDADARWVLRAANVPRAQNADFLPLLGTQLLDSLPQTGALLYLRGVGELRPWRHVGSSDHMRVVSTCRAAKLVVWGPEDAVPHPRCRAMDCADPGDATMKRAVDALALSAAAAQPDAEAATEAQLPLPPRMFCEDGDALLALRQAGLRNLSVPEAFLAVAQRAAALACLETGELLAGFLLQQPERLAKDWPRSAWMHLRTVAFVPCHDCRSSSGGDGTVPPALEAGECQRLAERWSYRAGISGRARHGMPASARSSQGGQRGPGGSGGKARAGAGAASWAGGAAALAAELEGGKDSAELDEEPEEEEEGEEGANAATADLLLRAARLLRGQLLDEATGGGQMRLVAPDKAPGDYLDRWHTWEAAPFLPRAWARAPDSLCSLLLSPPPTDRVLAHLRKLGQRVEQVVPEHRLAWRGALLWAFTAVRELLPTLPSSFQPAVVLDGGDVCRARELCMDLAQDLGSGATRVRAVPGYLRGLRSLLTKLGASTASVGVPNVEVSMPNPFAGAEAAQGLLACAVNDPTFADTIFHFECPGAGPHAEAYGHRLLLGRASEVFQAMVAGPLALAAARQDGRLHINLPPFVEPQPFAFVLAHIYTGATHDAGAAMGMALQPPSFEAAELVCSVLQLADHFMLPYLKQWCEVYLSQPDLLTVESIVDILTHADACNAPQLFHVCAHQIGLLYDAVVQTQQWASIPEDLKQRVASEMRRATRSYTAGR